MAVVSKGILSVLLASVLAAFNIQCAAWCVAEFCNPPASVPPCHHQHSAPSQSDSAACHHGLARALDAVTVITAAAAFDIAGLAAALRFEFPTAPGAGIASARAPSPPGLDRISSFVLRI